MPIFPAQCLYSHWRDPGRQQIHAICRIDLYNTASTAQQREEVAPRDGTKPGGKGKARTINSWRKTAKKAQQGETLKANRTLRTLNRISSLMPLQDRRRAFSLSYLRDSTTILTQCNTNHLTKWLPKVHGKRRGEAIRVALAIKVENKQLHTIWQWKYLMTNIMLGFFWIDVEKNLIY